MPPFEKGGAYCFAYVHWLSVSMSVFSEEKLKMSQPIRGRGSHLVFPIGPKKTWLRSLRSGFLSSFVEFRSAVPEEKPNMSQPIKVRAAISFCFTDWPEKHKLGRGHWDLASCQVLLNSVQQYLRRSQKCLSQSKAWPANKKKSCLSDQQENKRPKGPHNMHLSTMCQLFDGMARVAIFVYWSAEKPKHGRGCLRSCFLSTFNSVQWFQKWSRKCLSQSEAGAGHLVFPIGLENIEKHKLGRGR